MKTRLLIAALIGGVVLVVAVGGGVWYTTSISPTICWGKDAGFNSPDADQRPFPDGLSPDADQIKRGITHLHIAAAINACESAARLIAHGADVEVRDGWGQTPLHYSVSTHAIETAKLLIANNANVDARDESNLTPLHYAVMTNSIEIAELLIANNANVNAGHNTTYTPLWSAIRHAERIKLPEYPSNEEEKKYEKLKNESVKMIHLLRAHGGTCRYGC